MLSLGLRRALVQRRMLAGVVALVTAGATVLGVCWLLLSVTQDRAFTEELLGAQRQDVDVTAYLVGLTGADLVGTREDARDVVGGVLGPIDHSVTGYATSRMRQLGGSERLGYLVASDAFDQRAELTSGHWPGESVPAAGPSEAVVPDATAARLRLRVGDRVTLGEEIGLVAAEDPVPVVVVGTFRPLPATGWETDPLSGAGVDRDYSDGAVTAAAYGPFVVSDAAFVASGSTVEGMRVTAHPELAGADDAELTDAVQALGSASKLLAARVDDRVRITRVASDLPRTLDRVHAQQGSTRSLVLVVVLMGTALAVTAAVLAGRLVAAAREEERTLLVALGLGRRQVLTLALGEAGLLAGVAALLAVPAAALAHAAVTHLPGFRAAGLTQDPTVTRGLVLTVLAWAVLLAVALVVPALVAGSHRSLPRLRGAARAVVDLVLLALAATAWWQLRARPEAAAASGDVALTVAPLLCVAALALVAARWVRPLLALAARLGDRSRALVLPLAAHQAARRPHTGTAMVLLAAAAAAATFGLALGATWDRSQDDQAALRVGTDLSLALTAPATSRDAAAVLATTTGDQAVSAVTTRPIPLGSYLGDAGAPPVLVALDTRQAGTLLRGRLPEGATWAGVGADLAPGPPVEGLPMPAAGDGVQLTGQAPDAPGTHVTPTVLLQDEAGLRTPVSAAPVPIDGRSHPVRWREPVEPGQRLVAVRLTVTGDPAADPESSESQGSVALSVALTVPGGDPAAPVSDWQVRPLDPGDTPLRGGTVSVDRTATGAVVLTSTQVDLGYLIYGDGDLMATAFATPAAIPVAVSRQLADAVGATVGDELSGTVANEVLPLEVVSVVPTVPSAPGRAAVLVDGDTLSRALVGAGQLDPVVDGWWVARPTSGSTGALARLALGDLTTRGQVAAELRQGPLRVSVPAALLTLVAASVVLLVAGAGLASGVDRRRRSAEAARLRALGLTRREARRLLLAEHGAFLVPLVLAGTLAGAVSAAAIGPGLVRSDVGLAPVPAALLDWPWAVEGALVGGLLLACLVVAALVTSSQLRRSDTAHLRTDEW